MAENQQTVAPSGSTEETVSIKQRLAWVCGVFAMIIPFNLPSGYLNFFWTDIVRIPAGIVGTFLMVSKLWDALNDPIEGIIIDRTKAKGHSRYGRWIFPAGLASNILTVLCFVTLPGEPGALQYIYSLGVYFIFQVGYSCVEVPHIAMISTMTTDYKQRGVLTAWRETTSGIMLTIVARTFLPLTVIFGGLNLNRGYFLAALFYAVITVPFYYICTHYTQERYLPPPKAEGDKEPFFESLKCLKGNWPAISLFFAHLTWGLSGAFRGAAGMYFWTYIGGDTLYTAINGTWRSFGGIISAIFVGIMMKYITSKRNLAIMSWVICAALYVGMYFMPVNTDGARLAFNIVSMLQGIAGSVGRVCLFSMMPDCTEYTITKYGLRSSAFIVAIVNLAFKFGLSFGQGLFGWLLGSMNYVPGPNQPSGVILYFRLTMNIIPAVITLLGALAFLGFTLDKASHEAALRKIAEEGK